MSRISTAASPLAPSAREWRWQRFVALTTAAVLMLLGLLTTAVSTASADTPAVSARTPAGTVGGWGKREHLDLPSSLDNTGATAIAAAANHGLAITPDGEVVTWGDSDAGLPVVPASLTGTTVTAIAAGQSHDLALGSDHVVTAWGDDQYGQTDVPASLDGRTVTAVAAGGYHNLALTSDGKVTAWGLDLSGQTDVPASLDGRTVVAISAGLEHSLALTSDGKVTAWGEDAYGQADVPASLDSRTVTAISGGGLHSLALTSDGAVTAWGYAGSGQTSVPASLDGKTVTAIAAGFQHSLALTSDGRVTAWGADALGQSDVPASLDGRTVTAVAAGSFVSVALTRGLLPRVTSSPFDRTIEVGQETTLTAAATGDPVPTVQWQRAAEGGGFEDLPGATDASYTFTPVPADDHASYRAVFTNPYGSDTSFEAWLAVDDPPTAVDLEVTAGFETATPVNLATTVDDGGSLSYSIVTPPAHGTLSGTAPALRYTPETGYSGGDSFTYEVADATAGSAPATVSITVADKPNTAPTAADLEVKAGFGSTTPVTLPGTDPDGDPLTYAVVAGPAHGRLSDAAPTLTYTPDDQYSGADSFTYRVSDGSADSATASVRLEVAPRPCAPATPVRDFSVHVDQRRADGSVRTPKLRTTKPGELLLAYVAADGSAGRPQSVTGITGGGLAWTLVQRENTVRGTSEVWQAYATRKVRKARVEVDLAEQGRSVSVTVAGFSRAGSRVGSSAHAAGTTSAPRVTVTPRAPGSVVWAVGRVAGSRYHPEPVRGQQVVHAKTFTSPRAGSWTQRTRAAVEAGADVTITNEARATTWSYAAVEIPGACR